MKLSALILAVMFIEGSSIRLHKANKLNAGTCADKVREQIGEWRKVIDGSSCTGAKNRRVCEPSAFSNHFGEVDSARATNYLERAKTNATKIVPKPWLTIGDFAFIGNDYLDFYIYQLFFKERANKGTYVEMGGSNGVHASNTYFFDHALGWQGGLIEPTQCGLCQIPFNRPSAVVLHAGVCHTSTTKDFQHMVVKGFCRKGQLKGCDAPSMHKVKCEPMSELFSRISTGLGTSGETFPIDFFSLDVEKDWAKAWDTIDFEKTPISVFLLECNPAKKDRPKCEAGLKAKGYEFTWVSDDDILAWQPEVRPELCTQ